MTNEFYFATHCFHNGFEHQTFSIETQIAFLD